MKNKKGFILFGLITIISCFFCISSAKAYLIGSYNGIDYDEQKIYDIIHEYYPDFDDNLFNKFYIVKYNSKWFGMYFFTDVETTITSYKTNTSYQNYSNNMNAKYYYFEYIFNDGEPRLRTALTFKEVNDFLFTISSNNFYYNFDVYYNNNVWNNKIPKLDFTDIIKNSKVYNVNFHLNGGFNIDMSDILNWQFSYNDYSVSLYPNEIHDYISHLTFIKEKHAFDGLYYDEDFTMPYSPNDVITSDIDLYVKFTSKIYYTDDIDYIEIKFDDLPLAETNISYDYMIRSVHSDGSDNTIDFSQPYGREFYTGCDDDNSNCSPNLRYKDKLFYDMDFIGYYYTHHEDLTFNANPNHITSSYSVIIPLETIIANWIYIDFDCDYDYEIIVHYKNDENDKTSVSNYLETIDITNKYGAIFLPLYDNTAYADEGSYYLTHFKVLGTVDIQVTDSRSLTDYNILQLYSMGHCNYSYEKQDNRNDDSDLYIDKSIPYKCDNNTGIFKFKIDHNTAGQTLRFVNVNYSISADVPVKITYDTRYFNYGILDTPHSMVDIIDPTTGEVEHVGLSEFYNQLNKNENNKSFKLSLNRFIKPIKFIFRYVTKIFNNYLSASLQDYFFFVFCLALIILIVRVIF